jgi:DNA-binding CsgD family transcriptional regulator
MNEAERVSRLIDDIYDAALDPDRWSTVLDKTALSDADQRNDQAVVAAVQVMLQERSVTGLPERHVGVLAAHFRRALAIGKMINLHRSQAARLADALDGLAVGMFLVDAQARIVHANASGQAMLDTGAVVQETGSRLTALDRKAAQALRQAVAEAAAGETASRSVGLQRSDGEYFDAHVLALNSSARRQTGLPYAAVAAVFVRKAALDPCPLELIGELYGLTRAERRVLIAIVEIGGVTEVADLLGVSDTTVKTHLQHVFEKTGTKRQADLVKLVASHTSPLA